MKRNEVAGDKDRVLKRVLQGRWMGAPVHSSSGVVTMAVVGRELFVRVGTGRGCRPSRGGSRGVIGDITTCLLFRPMAVVETVFRAARSDLWKMSPDAPSPSA
jgi:hypothetical protein